MTTPNKIQMLAVALGVAVLASHVVAEPATSPPPAEFPRRENSIRRLSESARDSDLQHLQVQTTVAMRHKAERLPAHWWFGTMRPSIVCGRIVLTYHL